MMTSTVVQTLKQEERFEAFLATLRGGTYSYGRIYLRDIHNRYCGIGVALDLINPEAWVKGVSFWAWEGGHAVTPPSDALLAYYGMRNPWEIIHISDEERSGDWQSIAAEIEAKRELILRGVP